MEAPWSCDSVVVLPDCAQDGAVLFGKNSDRPVHDCSVLVCNEGELHAEGKLIDLGYGTVAQARRTFGTLGIAMYWNWGYEMGVNDVGVAGGVQATPTKEHAAALQRVATKRATASGPGSVAGPVTDDVASAAQTHVALSSCDLLRLGLERGDSARAVVTSITALLEQHGQWGSTDAAGEAARPENDNSFLIADATESWLLDTAGRQWVARRIRSGFHAASNELGVHSEAEWTMASASVRERAIEQGWWFRTAPGGAHTSGCSDFTVGAVPSASGVAMTNAGVDAEARTMSAGSTACSSAAAMTPGVGHASDTGSFDFSLAYTDHSVCMHGARLRAQRATQLLHTACYGEGKASGVTVSDLKSLLRDTLEGTFASDSRSNAAFPAHATIAMFESAARKTWGDTASSLIVKLRLDAPAEVHLCLSHPCVGIYLPFCFGSGGLSASRLAAMLHKGAPTPVPVLPSVPACTPTSAPAPELAGPLAGPASMCGSLSWAGTVMDEWADRALSQPDLDRVRARLAPGPDAGPEWQPQADNYSKRSWWWRWKALLQLVKGRHTQLLPGGDVINLALSYGHNAPLVSEAATRIEQELVNELQIVVQKSKTTFDEQGSASTVTSSNTEADMERLLLLGVARANSCLEELSNKLKPRPNVVHVSE